MSAHIPLFPNDCNDAYDTLTAAFDQLSSPEPRQSIHSAITPTFRSFNSVLRPRPEAVQLHRLVSRSHSRTVAVLFALDKVLNGPHSVTPDLAEELAAMAERKQSIEPTTVSPDGPPSVMNNPMRTPRDVMRHREEKEARKRAEVLRSVGQGQADPPNIIDTSSQFINREPVSTASDPYKERCRDHAPHSSADMLAVSHELLHQTQSRHEPRSRHESVDNEGRKPDIPAVRGIAPSGAAAAKARQSDKRGAAAGFPHAFERWENLSAHWEGLTSYWLHKLDSNKDSLDSKPSAAAMSRQITDLSAAGANLFHAVVELQRLRASSERKFQRWFLEVKQEQETIKESRAALEKKLEAERAGRAEEKALLSRTEIDRSLAEKRVRELTRELFINKEEARRAWEELGRREVEERDRTISLSEGLPTVVGGVQVVPMHASTTMSHQSTAEATQQAHMGAYHGVPGSEAYREVDASPTDTDPFTESGRHYELTKAGLPDMAAEESPVDSAQPSTGSTAQHLMPGVQPVFQQHSPSEDFSIAANQPRIVPAAGMKRYYDVAGHTANDAQDRSDREGHWAHETVERSQGVQGNADGREPSQMRAHIEDEYGDDDWSDVVDDRHHHPTRLSDVMEEDDEGRVRSKRSSVRS